MIFNICFSPFLSSVCFLCPPSQVGSKRGREAPKATAKALKTTPAPAPAPAPVQSGGHGLGRAGR